MGFRIKKFFDGNESKGGETDGFRNPLTQGFKLSVEKKQPQHDAKTLLENRAVLASLARLKALAMKAETKSPPIDAQKETPSSRPHLTLIKDADGESSASPPRAKAKLQALYEIDAFLASFAENTPPGKPCKPVPQLQSQLHLVATAASNSQSSKCSIEELSQPSTFAASYTQQLLNPSSNKPQTVESLIHQGMALYLLR